VLDLDIRSSFSPNGWRKHQPEHSDYAEQIAWIPLHRRRSSARSA
jgi:hypothetical protein